MHRIPATRARDRLVPAAVPYVPPRRPLLPAEVPRPAEPTTSVNVPLTGRARELQAPQPTTIGLCCRSAAECSLRHRRFLAPMVARLVNGRFHYAWVVFGVTFFTLLAAAGLRSMPGVLIVPLEN